MNCDAVVPHLSAFFDGELPTSSRGDIEEHLSSCTECRNALASMERLGALARTVVDAEPSVDLWPRIVAQLDGNVQTKPNHTFGWRAVRFMTLAGVVLVLFLGVRLAIRQGWFFPSDDQRLARIYDRYLAEFADSPVKAQKLLDEAFPSLSTELAESFVAAGGSMVGLRDTLPGLTRVAVHVRNLPCCDCVHGLYQRNDGTYVTVFEHELPISWQASEEDREIQFGEYLCRLRQSEGQLAASWQHDEKHFTVIGINSEKELKQIVERLDPSKVDQPPLLSPPSES
jgi:hypothetical protein